MVRIVTDAYVIDAVRTPIGRYGGALANSRPDDLAAHVVRAAVERNDLPEDAIEEVFMGCTNQAGEDNRNVARMASLLAGLPVEIPGVTVNRLCASGLEAVSQGARQIMLGDGDLVLAGGVESMTRAPLVMAKPDRSFPRGEGRLYDTTIGWRLVNPRMAELYSTEGMGETAENVAERYSVTRSDQDQFALESHRRAVAAAEAGRFDDEIVPVPAPQPKGEPVTVHADEQPRPDTSLEKLAKLPPAFDTESGNGTLTAGNSSPLTDGAAGLWVASDAGLGRLPAGTPRAKLIDFDQAAVDIQHEGLLMAPAYIIPRLLERNRMSYADVGLWEIHEAFAAQLLCHLKALETPSWVRDKAGVRVSLGTIPRDRINPNGGSVALGHPFAATGARILSQAIKELAAMPAGTRSIVSICADGGLGTVALLERG